MPFLFVDYDQGAGGERFCAGLSQSAECESLDFTRYENGRTKILDMFEQEFLKPNPHIDSNTKPHNILYTIIPTHRKTVLAHKLLGNISSIRISMPTDPELWDKVKRAQIEKVLLSKEPTQKYFFGLLKILQEDAVDKDFIQKVKYTMRTVELVLLSKGIDPTQQNIDEYINTVRSQHIPEPDFNYDLTIPYEDLVHNPNTVQNQIKSCFKINVVGDWLTHYA
jgi:hypothetical protein